MEETRAYPSRLLLCCGVLTSDFWSAVLAASWPILLHLFPPYVLQPQLQRGVDELFFFSLGSRACLPSILLLRVCGKSSWNRGKPVSGKSTLNCHDLFSIPAHILMASSCRKRLVLQVSSGPQSCRFLCTQEGPNLSLLPHFSSPCASLYTCIFGTFFSKPGGMFLPWKLMSLRFDSSHFCHFFHCCSSEIEGQVDPWCTSSSDTSFIFFIVFTSPLHGFPIPYNRFLHTSPLHGFPIPMWPFVSCQGF